MVQYEIKISGRVQGVGFRYFTHKKANEFGLSGWVKNTYDGGVQVMVRGDETDVETFIDHLRTGPPLSRVINLTKVKMPLAEEFTGFEVRY